MRTLRRIASAAAGLLAALVLAALPATAKPPLSAFADQAAVRSMEISPDGKQLAWIQRDGQGKEFLILKDLVSGKQTPLIDASNIKARALKFAGANYILLYGSKSMSFGTTREKGEFGGAFAVNIRTAKAKQLLPPQKSGGLTQSGGFNVLALDPGGRHAYMAAFVAENMSGAAIAQQDITLDLIKIDLETGARIGVGSKGSQDTRGWMSDAAGNPVVKFEQGLVSRLITVTGYDGGKARPIYTTDNRLSELSLAGIREGGKSVFVIDRVGTEFTRLFDLQLADGKLTPVLGRADADVIGVFADTNRVVKGVIFSGFMPSYHFFDAGLNADVLAVQKNFAGEAASLASWTDDWTKLVFLVEGGKFPAQYVLFDRTSGDMTILGQMRPSLTEADVGEVTQIRYPARDKTRLPALLTWPAGVAAEARNNLPVVVLPHGGPESYDTVSFDWLAQFLANEGYLVVQPQFRGSDGFGAVHRNAGRGQWGRLMQDDVTDALKAVVQAGFADPARACIVGWSYGGYAALAGGALTPELYKCVVSIAGVSHLPEMLDHEHKGGDQEANYIYWTHLIGDPAKDLARIQEVTPALHADRFVAPVLLIHGASDGVVPIRQSQLMESALKAAGKPVTFVRIGGDDHSLTESESRREAMAAVSEFLKEFLRR